MESPPPARSRRTPGLGLAVLAALIVFGAAGVALGGAAEGRGSSDALAVTVSAADASSVSLTWSAASDQFTTFVLFHDLDFAGRTDSDHFTFTGLACGTTHRLDVFALGRDRTAAHTTVFAATRPCSPASPPPAPNPNPQPEPQPPPPSQPQPAAPPAISLLLRSLDGSLNNEKHEDWGGAGTQYTRTAPTNYADGKSAMVDGPPARMISNRIFNDGGQNLFSANGISQWGWAWGQFIDHDMDLRDETPGEKSPMRFDPKDPYESFANDLGRMDFARTPAAPGTGQMMPRQQINTISSFIDASQVYGTTADRLKWLRADSSPDLLLPDGFLPRADARGSASSAPPMDLMGALAGNPSSAVEAGDVRANENLALTSLQTLFAREHNRIADALPASLGNELRFQIARRVVGAEIQYVTYNEFLPTLGVGLDPYRGYDPSVNPGISNEFATVGFRAHSMVHGEFEPSFSASEFDDTQLSAFKAHGAQVEQNTDGTFTIVIPLAVAFGNPDLIRQIGLGPALASLGERQYANDDQIDNSMRSILFQVPKPGVPDPSVCGAPRIDPDCFSDVEDLGADDVERGRDHGMPAYNELRRAYGLPAVIRFTDITGEDTEALPDGLTCDDPATLSFTDLHDDEGNPVALDDEEDAVSGTRASTLAARLECLYGSVDTVDAFVGMVSEKHVPGTEFGPLQLAIWKRQFTALREGDRFFYENDPALALIEKKFGITFRHTLAEIVKLDTGTDVAPNVFKAADD